MWGRLLTLLYFNKETRYPPDIGPVIIIEGFEKNGESLKSIPRFIFTSQISASLTRGLSLTLPYSSLLVLPPGP